jgi:4-hydroxybenzoate polyprenyltransferase
LILFLGGSPLASAIHLADAIPDRDRDGEAGLETLAVALGKPRAERAAVGLLLIGALVSIVLLLRHGQPLIAALFVVGVVVVGLSSRADPSSLLGKWIVIVAAAVAAVPLVAWASER